MWDLVRAIHGKLRVGRISVSPRMFPAVVLKCMSFILHHLKIFCSSADTRKALDLYLYRVVDVKLCLIKCFKTRIYTFIERELQISLNQIKTVRKIILLGF